MKITENIDLIDKTMCNVYVLKVSGKIIQIDAGMKGSAKLVLNYYKEKGIKPDIVLITHYHLDHIGGLKIIKDTFNADIFASSFEIPVIEGKSSMGRPKSLGARLMFSLVKPEPVTGVKDLKELKIDGLKVIETPGHTPGSVSFFVESERAVFIGDAAGNVNGDLKINEKYTLDMEKAKDSLERIKSLSPVLVLPGHGAPLKI
ncbi:MAG: MBL fold metallo-hydrolase [Thermoplasmata archaeon]|nr:MBL fold metallo-hydrolase [Thermoplasmata archaeon]